MRTGREEESLTLTTTLWGLCDCPTFPARDPSLVGVERVPRGLRSRQQWRWARSSAQSEPKAGLASCAAPGPWPHLRSAPVLSPERSTWQHGTVWPERRSGQCWPMGILSLSIKAPTRASFKSLQSSWTFHLLRTNPSVQAAHDK